MLQNRFGRSRFDLFAEFEHHNLISNFTHYAKVVRNEKDRRAVLLLKFQNELQNARLRRHIERGGGFVADQQIGLKQEGHCNHNALTLSARKLMRI